MQTQLEVISQLPSHLRAFVTIQEYDNYTPRDHAVWRFVLKQLLRQLDGIAHPTFFSGLKATAIAVDTIPRIEHINDALNKFGWQAVVVDGFLPPAIFMEFQAHCVLPIAVAIRSLSHILYTPAPDIIHETVGHAPFIVDIDYAEFLQRFGELGMKAICNQADVDIYEAIRRHSILMESPVATAQQRSQAAERLQRQLDKERGESEASLLSRLHWWTVEYGLVGNIDQCLVFGAGLLSSLGESRYCLNDPAVAKKPLTLNAILQDYDITHAQPQLYVTDSCRHLRQVLDEFARGMCYQLGGEHAVVKAIESGSVNTVQFDSGIEISGIFSELVTDAVGNICYLRTASPTQLSFEGEQLCGHGIDTHGQGFGTAMGRIKNLTHPLSQYSVDELKLIDIDIGHHTQLNFVSGISVTGKLEHILRKKNRNILFRFSNCTVRDVEGQLYFLPEWGNYDLAVGDSVTSVYGGASDKQHYPIYSQPATTKLPAVVTKADHAMFALYQQIRSLRESATYSEEDIKDLVNTILSHSELDWLLYFETLELSYLFKLPEHYLAQLRDRLAQRLNNKELTLAQLVEASLHPAHAH